MLQEFRVDNFKSLINIVFKPQETICFLVRTILSPYRSFIAQNLHFFRHAPSPFQQAIHKFKL